MPLYSRFSKVFLTAIIMYLVNWLYVINEHFEFPSYPTLNNASQTKNCYCYIFQMNPRGIDGKATLQWFVNCMHMIK